MLGCYPYVVRAMWLGRSSHVRSGAVLGSVGRLLALLCVSWHVT